MAPPVSASEDSTRLWSRYWVRHRLTSGSHAGNSHLHLESRQVLTLASVISEKSRQEMILATVNLLGRDSGKDKTWD